MNKDLIDNKESSEDLQLKNQSNKGTISPTHNRARNLGSETVAKVKKKTSTALDPVKLKTVAQKIKEVVSTLNSCSKVLCQTRFEAECDHTEAFLKLLDDIALRSNSLLQKVEKSKSESQKVLKSKVKVPVKS
jgi:hypothetical protein